MIPAPEWEAVCVAKPGPDGKYRFVRYPLIAWVEYENGLEAWILVPIDGPMFSKNLESLVCFTLNGQSLTPEQLEIAHEMSSEQYPSSS